MSSDKTIIEEYLLTITNQEKKNYLSEIIHQLELKNSFIAYHGSCTDGSITAALLYYFEPDKALIPLDYNLLKDSIIRDFLIKQNWFAIVDLEPFNEYTLELYVDHHRSVIGSPINAKRIHFEVGEFGQSAAYVLYNSLVGFHEIPFHLKKLVEVSKVTDTASFAIDPPVELISKSDYDRLDSDFDQLCWFVQDATNVEENYSLEKNNELVIGLSKEGIKYLFSKETINTVNKLREKRLLAEKFIQRLEIKPLMVIINSPDNAYKQYIALRLGKIGSKVIAFFSQKDEVVTISLRQSKRNTKEEIDYYRLDLLAKRFSESGGGHSEASGSIAPTLDYALKIIREWSIEKNLDYLVHKYENL